ncbi:MAG: potassium transporter [Cytophagaceae bacterium]|nr:potassium transporter [Cytophagaceae bacterium]
MRNNRKTAHRDVLLENEEKRLDLGFGKQITDQTTRLINPDGSFNVRRVNQSFFSRLNLYHRLITMSWRTFILLILGAFFVTNFIFAGLYELLGIEHLAGVDQSTAWTRFYDAYFFSAQTLTTVGYGRIAPVGFWTSAVAATESMLGLLTFALATGLLYGRFSRPIAPIRFSERAIIAPYLDTTALMFRIVNERANQLIEINVEVALSLLEDLPNGRRTRKYYALSLERGKVNFFPLNWTLVHPITEESPLFGKTSEELVYADAEVLILVRATEDTFSQTVYARSSYQARDFEWGVRFKTMYDNQAKGITTLDISKLSDTEPAPLVSNLVFEEAPVAKQRA